ncbi:hypothetical protein NX059_000552 [Plenodomus lindquistii]|nr:hypothetical protein NX059_000552 [Plenodomus lindquistii]
MTPLSPSMQDSSDSRECSPVALDRLNLVKLKAAANQHNPLLNLPDDIFKCVIDYLDRDTAWSLKRLCKGMASSLTVNQLLYRSPMRLSDVRDIRLGDWKYKVNGSMRWAKLQSSINDVTRHYVHKLAMSHWASIDDFRWIEANLPALTSLNISAIKDFVWTPEETWSWKMLAEACPKLFSQLKELQVANWADYTTHARIEYSYSYNDYRFKQKFRISRRRDGGSVASMIFPLCSQLQTLAIRDCYSGFHTWNEWEVHQRVCSLVDGIQQHCPASLTKLKVHDYAPYRSLFSTDATTWSRLKNVEINLYGWMEDRRDRDVIGPIPYRITQGHHHREEEEAFDDKSFSTCERDHMALGNHVVQDVGASFEDLLQSLQTISKRYPNISIKPSRNLDSITLHPFHLVNVMQRRYPFGHAAQQTPDSVVDPSSKPEVQEALRWLAEKCSWKPILAWDSMMCDVFPANLEPNRTFLPKLDVLSRIKTMVSTLRGLMIPIRISIGDRSNSCPSFGLDGSLYFGDFKTFVGEGDAKHEILRPTQASYNLMPIASMVDELTISYPVDVPGVSGWRAASRATPAETALMKREMIGWRRFWFRYASQFKNLKKLTANVPDDIYEDWGKSELASLLSDERWEMLEVEEQDADYGFFNSYFPFSSTSLTRRARRCSRIGTQYRKKFVQRVFFRLDDKPLNITPRHPELSDQEGDEKEITDDEIKDVAMAPHRFWMKDGTDEEQREKRKRCDKGGESHEKGGKKRKVVEESVAGTAEEAVLDHVDRTFAQIWEL